MTHPTLPERVAAMRAAVEAMTTPAPWILREQDGRKNQRIESEEIVQMDRPDRVVASLLITAWKQDKRDARPDARGICHLRNHALSLLSELMAENARLREALGRIARYPICRVDEIGIQSARDIARAALENH